MPIAGVCPFARAFVGEVRTDGTIDKGIDAVVVTSTCDQMRRSAEFFARVPAFLMNVPATWRTTPAVRLYMDELRRLGRFLADRGGHIPSDEGLADAMESLDRRRAGLGPDACPEGADQRRALKGPADASPACADASPKGVPVAVIGGPLMRGAAAPTAAPEPGDETPGPANHAGPTSGDETPGPANHAGPTSGDEAPGTGWLSDAVENAGGRIVLDGTEGGERTSPAPFDRRRLRDEPLMVLAESYFGCIPDAFRRPDSMLYEWAAREVPASGARGVILIRYIWCDMWAIARERLGEATGLPVLDIDFAGDADAEARAAGRIAAFVEALS
jgi:benzoyl-CoA reductase/2-hydroxyglutaryl-CoA dehydratase subunit BcrC/BadD/HgdB